MAAGFVLGNDGYWDVSEEAGEEGWETDPRFLEVPCRLLAAEDWATRALGPWQWPEGIFVLESRALLKALERIAFTRFGRSIRQVILTDNMSVVLCFSRLKVRNDRAKCAMKACICWERAA